MAQVGSLERLYESYRDRVEFIVVYIREAHPGSIVPVDLGNGKTELQIVSQTTTVGDRVNRLRELIRRAHLTMPAVTDDEESSVKRAYAAWPDRLYGIGTDGKISFKSGPGPAGFKVPDLEAWLRDTVK